MIMRSNFKQEPAASRGSPLAYSDKKNLQILRSNRDVKRHQVKGSASLIEI